MKTTNTFIICLIKLVCWIQFCDAQDKTDQFTIESASIANPDFIGYGTLSPIIGDSYTIVPGLGVEAPDNGGLFFLGLQPHPNSGVVNHAIINNQADAIGTDFADAFGLPANEIVAYECIESLGIDPSTGRFLLKLTLTVETTATELQWDSFEFDLLDPGDVDEDGNTIEPDGHLDTGDGVADQPFPLDPVGLLFHVDLDGDGDPTNDTPLPVVTQGLFLGGEAGGLSLPFDADAGDIALLSGSWELRNFAGELADIDLDGTADGPFAPINPCPICSYWSGNLSAVLGVDGDVNTAQDSVSGTVKTSRFILTYLSDVENEFCFGSALLGDINLDGDIDLLDIQPFVNLLATQTFQGEADINGDGEVSLLDVAPFVMILTN